MPSPLEADIVRFRQQVDVCASALEDLEAEPESRSRTAELKILIEALCRYQMTLERLTWLNK